MAQGNRVEATGRKQRAKRVGDWLGRLVGRAEVKVPALRLYQIGPGETVLLSVPEAGFDFARSGVWSQATAVDAAGRLRPSGETPQARDALLLAAPADDLAKGLRAQKRPPLEPRIHDLRDPSGVVAGIRVRVPAGSALPAAP